MVSHREVERQLKAIGAEFRFWNKPEIRELKHVLVHGERIMHCVSGRYEAGFAILCITDQRVLLIDKKPFYLTLEDVRYDMVAEVDLVIGCWTQQYVSKPSIKQSDSPVLRGML
jgi:hypothetical protein